MHRIPTDIIRVESVFYVGIIDSDSERATDRKVVSVNTVKVVFCNADSLGYADRKGVSTRHSSIS